MRSGISNAARHLFVSGSILLAHSMRCPIGQIFTRVLISVPDSRKCACGDHPNASSFEESRVNSIYALDLRRRCCHLQQLAMTCLQKIACQSSEPAFQTNGHLIEMPISCADIKKAIKVNRSRHDLAGRVKGPDLFACCSPGVVAAGISNCTPAYADGVVVQEATIDSGDSSNPVANATMWTVCYLSCEVCEQLWKKAPESPAAGHPLGALADTARL